MNHPVLGRADINAAVTSLPHFDICERATSFVYLLQAYDFRGYDVAVWYRIAEDEIRVTVRATGPVLLDPKSLFGPLKQVSSTERQTVIQEILNKNMSWQIQRDDRVNPDEFLEAMRIATAITTTRTNLLGTDREWRVVGRHANVELDTLTNGHAEYSQHDGKMVALLLSLAGIDNVPAQVIGVP